MSIIAGLIGAGVGLYTSLTQQSKAEELLKKAKKLRPSDVDPNQVLLQQELKRKQKAIESGTDPLTALATKQIKSNLASTQQGLISASRGSTRTLVEGFAQSERAAGDEIGKLFAANIPRSQFYEGLGYDLSQIIDTTKRDIQTYDYVSALARATAMEQTANINTSNLVTDLLSGIGSLSKYSTGFNNTLNTLRGNRSDRIANRTAQGTEV